MLKCKHSLSQRTRNESASNALPAAVTVYFCSRVSFVFRFVLEAMADVNYASRAQNRLIDRYEGLIRTLRQVYALLHRGRSTRARALLQEVLNGEPTDSATDAADSTEAAQQLSMGEWVLRWYEQLPPRVAAMFPTADDEQSLLAAFAYAQQHYPEEVVLWTLAGGVVPDPWVNASVQEGVRSSLLALRNLRSAPPGLQPSAPGLQPSAPPGIQPFSGMGHRLN